MTHVRLISRCSSKIILPLVVIVTLYALLVIDASPDIILQVVLSMMFISGMSIPVAILLRHENSAIESKGGSREVLTGNLSRLFAQIQKVPNIRPPAYRQLTQKLSDHIRNPMNNTSVTYPLELLFSSESVTLYFKVSKKVQAKDLVAAVRCFDHEGSVVPDLISLPFSSVLSRHYVYLRPQQESAGEWIKAEFSVKQPVKHIEVEVVRWRKSFENKIEDVVLGLWAGETLKSEALQNSVNFVAIQGTK